MNKRSIVINDKFFPVGNLSDSGGSALLDFFNNQKSNDTVELNKKLQTLFKKHGQKKDEETVSNTDLISIKNFLLKLKQQDFFNKFSTINLFIHEKGLNSCIKYELSGMGLKTYIKKITDFNKLFQSIKKSKNKSFGQSTLKGVDFEIIGTFLAKNFSLSKYNAIFIVSRDDFLPQQEVDISKFNEFCELLEFQLEIIFQNISIFEKSKLASKIIETLPIEIDFAFPAIQPKPIRNSLENKKIIFKNNVEISINKNSNTSFDHVDLFHKERIKLLGDLLNTLRHEISNPLFGLKLTSELLTTENLNESQTEFLSEILNSLNRCTSIIEDFTNLYSSESIQKEIKIVQLVNEVLTLTKSETRQIRSEIKFNDLDKEVTVNTNPTWIVQILFNLVINAAHALRDSEIQSPKIQLWLESSTDSINIFIKDNGPNISQDKQAMIFKPFFTTKATGTGLGLPISQSLAKKIGGNLEYIFEPGGACFKLSIPNE